MAGYDVYQGGAGTLVQASERKARKAHRCMECGRIIDRGELYCNERWRFASGLCEYKLCADCRSAARLMVSYAMRHLWPELAEALRWDGGEAAACRLDELTARARRRVCGMIEDVWRG